MSANLHSAASVVQWHGTDFNPRQAAFAQELAGACGSGAQLFEEGFDDFCGRSELNCLASPMVGGSVAVPRFHQLFLLTRQQGHKQPFDWAQFVWILLSAQSQRLVKQGATLESAADNLVELTDQVQTFAAKQFPILKALQIA